MTDSSAGNAIVLRDAGEHKFNGKNFKDLQAADVAIENLRENYPRFDALTADFSLSNIIEIYKNDPEDSLSQEFLYRASEDLSELAGELGISVDDSSDQARFDSLQSILSDDEQYERINSFLTDRIEANRDPLGLDEVNDSSLQDLEQRLLAPLKGRLVSEEDYESIFGSQLKGPVSDATDSHRLAVELTSLSSASLQETYLIVTTVDGREIVAQATEGTSWATPDCASGAECLPVE